MRLSRNQSSSIHIVILTICMMCTLCVCAPVPASAQVQIDTSSRAVDSVVIYYFPFNAMTNTRVTMEYLTSIRESVGDQGRLTITDSLRTVRLYNAILLSS